jgi:hypothetical protein
LQPTRDFKLSRLGRPSSLDGGGLPSEDCSPTQESKMSEPNSIKINEVEYIRKDAAKSLEGDIKIVILDRGFVYVGRVALAVDFLTITDAKNIRVWGTSQGLGELVSGPKSATKLDQVGTVRVPMRALISLIDVEQSKWKSVI